MPHSPRWTDWIIVALACLFALLTITWCGQPNPVDDAYITFTYAKSVLTGRGLVYPPQERVFGSTSPFYVLLLTLGSSGTGPDAIPAVAVWINALALCAIVFLVYAVFVTLGVQYREAGLLAAVLVALHPKMLASALGGMESLVFTATVLAAIWLCLHGRDVACGVLLGLAVLTRPEGAVAGVLIGLWRWRVLRRLPWRVAIPAAATVLPWLVLATMWFGSPLPHNLVVKLRAFHHYDAYPGATLKMLLVELPDVLGVHDLNRSRVGRSPWSDSPDVLASALLVLVLAAAFATRRRESLLISATLLLYILFHAAGNKLYFGWYGVPLIPLVLATVMGGLHSVFSGLLHEGTARRQAVARLALILSAALLLLRTPPCPHALNTRYNVLVQGEPGREPNYRAAAEFLNARSATPDTVAVPEVGAVGFYTHHHCIDLVGLVTPHVLPLRRAGLGYWEITQRFHPRWIVTHAGYATPFLTNAMFHATYRRIAEAGPVMVFERHTETNLPPCGGPRG